MDFASILYDLCVLIFTRGLQFTCISLEVCAHINDLKRTINETPVPQIMLFCAGLHIYLQAMLVSGVSFLKFFDTYLKIIDPEITRFTEYNNKNNNKKKPFHKLLNYTTILILHNGILCPTIYIYIITHGLPVGHKKKKQRRYKYKLFIVHGVFYEETFFFCSAFGNLFIYFLCLTNNIQNEVKQSGVFMIFSSI